MDLKSSTMILKPKKRQFYNHERTLRYMDPLFKQNDIYEHLELLCQSS